MRSEGRAGPHDMVRGSDLPILAVGSRVRALRREKMGLAAVQRVMSGGTRVEAGR